jgi:DNA-binding IclR family transcriptional regulator
VRCLAVAIQDAKSDPVAAVSISGPAFRVTGPRVPLIVEKLMECVKGIRRDMGYKSRKERSLGLASV